MELVEGECHQRNTRDSSLTQAPHSIATGRGWRWGKAANSGASEEQKAGTYCVRSDQTERNLDGRHSVYKRVIVWNLKKDRQLCRISIKRLKFQTFLLP